MSIKKVIMLEEKDIFKIIIDFYEIYEKQYEKQDGFVIVDNKTGNYIEKNIQNSDLLFFKHMIPIVEELFGITVNK